MIILAIDDNPDNIISLKALIYEAYPKAKFLNAINGKEGIRIAETESPDVILLDIIMPGMDGYEVCQILKSKTNTQHIPILMLTAIKTDSNSRAKGLRLGADAFLSKPIDYIELSAQIQVLLRIKFAEDKLREKNENLEDLIYRRTNELIESKERYKALYNNAPLSYQSMNSEGIIIDVNPYWLSTLGYTRDEVIGKPFKNLLSPEDKKVFDVNFLSFISKGSLTDVVYKIFHKKGHLLDVSYQGKVGYFPNGKVKETYCVFQDITEKVKTEKKIIKEESLLIAIFESIGSGLIAVSNEGKVTHKNGEFIKMWNIPDYLVDTNDDKELLDFVSSQLIDSEQFIKKVDDLYKCLKTSTDIIQFKDGRIFERTTQPLIEDGENAGRVWAFRDITKRKIAEFE